MDLRQMLVQPGLGVYERVTIALKSNHNYIHLFQRLSQWLSARAIGDKSIAKHSGMLMLFQYCLRSSGVNHFHTKLHSSGT